MDAGRAPARVSQAHLGDEISHFTGHARTALEDATPPRPVKTKSLAVPGNNSRWFHHQQGRASAGPEPRKPYPQNAIGVLQAKPAVPARPLQHQKLMTQCEDLSLQSSTRSETDRDRGEQAKEESKHYPAAYTPRLHKSNRFNDNEFLVWTPACE